MLALRVYDKNDSQLLHTEPELNLCQINKWIKLQIAEFRLCVYYSCCNRLLESGWLKVNQLQIHIQWLRSDIFINMCYMVHDLFLLKW